MTTQTNEAGMKHAGRRVYGATALIALAVLFIGVTILITFVLRGARIDLTESKLYSIAPGTQRIVSSLAEPINLYFFFSQEASSQSPPLRAYAQRVRELLEEMEQRSKGKLRLSVIDPKPFSEDEDRAAEFGLAAAPLGASGESLYFGLGRHELDGRPRSDSVLPAGQGRISRVRHCEPHPSAEQSEAPGGRLAGRSAG